MKALTDKQRTVLDFLTEYQTTNQRPPTYREISIHFDFSIKAAYDHVQAIAKKGFNTYLKRIPSKGHHGDNDIELVKKTRRETALMVRDGIMLKRPCMVCGCLSAETHHEDYADPVNIL